MDVKTLKVMASMTIVCLGFAAPSFGKKIEIGNAMSSWLGKGEIHEVGNGHVLFNGVIEGVIFVHKRGEGMVRAPLQSARMYCPVQMNLNKKTKARNSQGFCVITPTDSSGKIYTLVRCSSSTPECEGEWTHIGGAGDYAGISGTTKFRSRIDIGPREGNKEVTISGYAVWPNLSHELP